MHKCLTLYLKLKHDVNVFRLHFSSEVDPYGTTHSKSTDFVPGQCVPRPSVINISLEPVSSVKHSSDAVSVVTDGHLSQ